MSFTGKFTPLGLNVVSGFMQATGLGINSQAAQLQGTWTPSSYTPGSLVSGTILDKLTQAITLAYTYVSPSTFIALTTIGSTTIPALGNSRPAEFIRTYPGPSDPYPPVDYPNPLSTYSWLGGWDRTGLTPQYIAIASASDEYFKYGFIGCIARQAYYELFVASTVQYLSFVKSWVINSGWLANRNTTISSFANGNTFMLGSYSNMNDLTTGDVSGVTTSFKLFGEDLINLGRILNLATINRFGLPSTLLLTLQSNNALTDALKLALLYSLSTQELTSILTTAQPASQAQERKIYQAFEIISGSDLVNILATMNCQTKSIPTLASLLDPRFMFPSSYQTLTVPTYSATTTSSKIYNFIYINGGVNTSIQNWGKYLTGILSEELALACGAFSMTMQQVKKITTMDSAKFSQVVSNLEITTQGLSLLSNTQGAPGNQAYNNSALAKLALGSGTGGTYRYCDFYGAASGIPYVDNYNFSLPLLNQLATTTLSNIYTQMLANYNNEAQLIILIAQANAEIAAIKSNNQTGAAKLNTYWSALGKQLAIEQRAIPFSVPDPVGFISALDNNDINSFVKNVENYAANTEYGGSAPVLENLCNLTNLSGQSLLGLIKESRNAARLLLVGAELDNNIPDTLGTPNGPVSGSTNVPAPAVGPAQASASVIMQDGLLSSIAVDFPGSGYDACQPPAVMILPIPTATVGATFTAVVDPNSGGITQIQITNPGDISGYNDGIVPQLYIASPPGPARLGMSTEMGSFASSPAIKLVPNNLITSSSSSNTV